MVEFDQKVGDGLIGEEGCHRRQQQVDEDEHNREDVLQAGFTEPHRRTVLPDVILCSEEEEEARSIKSWLLSSNVLIKMLHSSSLSFTLGDVAIRLFVLQLLCDLLIVTVVEL